MKPKELLMAFGNCSLVSHMRLCHDHILCEMLRLFGTLFFPLRRRRQLFPVPLAPLWHALAIKPPSLSRMQSWGLYLKIGFSMQKGFVAIRATSWERLCLPPHWHCSFCPRPPLPFFFPISRGLNAIKLIGSQGVFPAYFPLASWVQEGTSLMLAAFWFSQPDTHFFQVGARTWPKLSKLRVPIWEQNPHKQKKKIKLTVRLQYYVWCFVVLPSLTHKLFKVFLPELSYNTGLFAEHYLFTCIEATF